MDYNKIEDTPSTDSRGNKVPPRLLRDLKKLQSEAMQRMPEGPRHCLSIDRSGETQVLTVRISFVFGCSAMSLRYSPQGFLPTFDSWRAFTERQACTGG